MKRNTRRLTFHAPSGEWGIDGVNLTELSPILYACAAKLKDYEDTGFSPDEASRLIDRVCAVGTGCANVCVCCGAYIPEGRMVCPECEHKAIYGKG